MDAVKLLLTRASNPKLAEPAPDAESLDIALRAALRAPDHKLLRPWRLLLVRGESRHRLGDVFAEALRRRQADASSAALDKARGKPLRAPLLIVVAAVFADHPGVPRDEQLASAAAAAQNVMLALHARGYAAMWRTGDPAYDDHVKRALGLRPEDALVGFIYTGTARSEPPDIPRPEPPEHVTEWTEPAR